MNILDISSVENSELVDASFHFWFSDQEHLRSPFPSYIRPALKPNSIERFYTWINGLSEEAKDEMNEEMVAEKLEEIIFEEAHKLVMTDDEKITILYPFLPRVGDAIQSENEPNSIIIDRIIKKDGDTSYMHVNCENQTNKEKWKTSFELPL
jgi:hypothetical protein